MTTCNLDHVHLHGGSYKCYSDGGCRCGDCKKRNAEYALNRAKQIAYGRWDTGMVPAEPVREHIRMLQASGYGVARIVELSGAPAAAVNRCAFKVPGTGKLSRTIKRSTAEKILAVQPNPDLIADGARVPATGTRRRVQALVCNGFSLAFLARRLGMEKWNFWKLLRHEKVLASTHRAVVDLYDELWDQTPEIRTAHDKGSFTAAKKYAAQQGWVSALAWDDIDDPNETPAEVKNPDRGKYDPIAVELAVSGERVPLIGCRRATRLVGAVLFRGRDMPCTSRDRTAGRWGSCVVL